MAVSWTNFFQGVNCWWRYGKHDELLVCTQGGLPQWDTVGLYAFKKAVLWVVLTPCTTVMYIWVCLSRVGYTVRHMANLKPHRKKTPVLRICFTQGIFLPKSILPATPKGLAHFLLLACLCCAAAAAAVHSTLQSGITETNEQNRVQLSISEWSTLCAASPPLPHRSIPAKLSCFWGKDLNGPFGEAARLQPRKQL